MLWKSHENVIKTQESIFQGPEYRYFIFMAYFSGHEFAMKSWCVIDSMGHENYTQRF